MLRALFFLLFSLVGFANLEKTIYPLENEPIDVLIPCTEKDLPTLIPCIKSIMKYVKDVRRIIVISNEHLTPIAEWYDEKNLPFSKEMIAEEIFSYDKQKALLYVEDPKNRLGWMLQQFIKLYAPLLIENISSNVLVVDADVIFLNPIAFLNEKKEPYLTIAYEDTSSYFAHMQKLLPGLTKVNEKQSGVAHHMLFQKSILTHLHEKVSEVHQCELWRAFCRCMDLSELYQSPFSEYEVYYNFALHTTHQAHPRKVLWTNVPRSKMHRLKKIKKRGYSFVACHSYM